MDAERVVILHATGRSAEALALGRAAAARRPDFASLAALAVLHAERNELAPAEALFTACLARYRGVSPFPVAHLECLRGRMWQRAGDAPRARRWYARAIERVPAYAPARDRTRELDASPGLAEQPSAARPAARDGGEHHVGEGRC